jgi:hypothetical protein
MFRPTDVADALDDFEHVEIRLLAGRFVRVHPRLFANDIAFRAQAPLQAATNRPTRPFGLAPP